MPKFGTVPKEVPVQRDWLGCAPKFVAAVAAMLADLKGEREEWAFETRRTAERQRFLYGFGRDYDDGRGKVTNAQTALYSWHGFGLAVDVVEKDATPWDAPISFWETIGETAERHGLVWGGRWRKPDLPHVQWRCATMTPTDGDRLLYEKEGITAVWSRHGAV